MASRQFESRDADEFRRFIQQSVVIVDGGAESDIDVRYAAWVHVAVVFDVSGYGPHQAAIYAIQNHYHGSADAALDPAFEILEEWIRDHYHQDADPDDESVTETFDARGWKLSAFEFAEAIEGTNASKFIDIAE